MNLFDFSLSPIEIKYNELLEKCFNEEIQDEDISLLTDNEKIFYVLYTFDMEFQNGGLCQFFVNSSRNFAPYVSEYLEKVGAIEHKKLFDNFIKSNDINLNDLSFFIIDDLDFYEEKCNAYPFDDFDDEFSELPELIKILEEFLNDILNKD